MGRLVRPTAMRFCNAARANELSRQAERCPKSSRHDQSVRKASSELRGYGRKAQAPPDVCQECRQPGREQHGQRERFASRPESRTVWLLGSFSESLNPGADPSRKGNEKDRQQQSHQIQRPQPGGGVSETPAKLRPKFRAEKPGHGISPVRQKLGLDGLAARDPQDAFVDEGEEVFGSIDELLLLSVEVDQLLKVRLVVFDQRVHVPALRLEELSKKLLDLFALFGRYGLVDRLHDLVDERVDVRQRLTLLAKLDLLELHAADLLLAHAYEPAVHADVWRLCPMPSQQHAHRIRKPHGLDPSCKPNELRLDLGDLGLGSGELLTDVVDLIVEAALASPNRSQRFISLVELVQRLLEPHRKSRQLFHEQFCRLVLALDLEPLHVLRGLTQLPAESLIVGDSQRRAVTPFAEKRAANIVGSKLVLVRLDLRSLHCAPQTVQLGERLGDGGIGARRRRRALEILQALLRDR